MRHELRRAGGRALCSSLLLLLLLLSLVLRTQRQNLLQPCPFCRCHLLLLHAFLHGLLLLEFAVPQVLEGAAGVRPAVLPH